MVSTVSARQECFLDMGRGHFRWESKIGLI